VEPLFVWKQLIDLVGEGRIYFRRASEPPVLIAHVGRGGNPTAHTYLAADLARAASRSCGDGTRPPSLRFGAPKPCV
jgi:hypothetical protein